jgi:hypothetical protein
MSRPRLGPRGGGPEFLGQGDGGGAEGWEDYDFAVIRVVPHVHLELYENIGVVLHGRTSGFLDARVLTDREALGRLAPGTDTELLTEYLEALTGIARGDESCGPMALSPPSERFHWITAPRSDVVQCSKVRAGRSTDLEATLKHLYAEYVEGPVGG